MLISELESFYRSLSSLEATPAYKRNRLKEFLHLILLDFIYTHEQYRELIFYGGTCLRHCFGLPRLSEDLDFEYLGGTFSFDQLATHMQRYFKAAHHYDALSIKSQKFRLYLKFPVLRQLGIVSLSESEFLHIKIEVDSTTHPEGSFATEVQPIFAMQRTFFVKRYDLPTLMASKINALINRNWGRHDKGSGTLSDAKGRDYFDLLWYMSKGVQPNVAFTNFKSVKELWSAIDEKVRTLKLASIKNDLVDFLEYPGAADDFSRNLRDSYKTLRASYDRGKS